MVQQNFHLKRVIAAEAEQIETENCKRLQGQMEHDANAFWRLWHGYQESLFFRCCLRWMRGHHEDAEDALGSASLKSYDRFQRYSPGIANTRAWLIRLIYNHCIDLRRVQERRSRTLQLVENPDDMKQIDLRQWQDSPEDIILRREAARHIQQAIDDLPPRLRELSRLRFFDELPCRDIAEQLNLSPENVRKRLQQARLVLRKTLSTYHFTPAGMTRFPK